MKYLLLSSQSSIKRRLSLSCGPVKGRFIVMKTNAAPRDIASLGLRAAPIAALIGLLASLCFASPASAAKKRHTLVGNDGKIRACYRVKGKPRGMVRVVRGKRHRCRRGERRMAFVARGPRGQVGPPGAQGAKGDTGASGPAGSATASSSADVAGLESEIGLLTQRVESLEGVLNGITNGDLTGILATLNGITNEDLLGTIGAVSVLNTACATLVERSNSLLGFLDILDTLDILGLPAILNPLSVCPET
jgi:hypothetical protein